MIRCFNSTRIGKKRVIKQIAVKKMQSFSDFKTGDYVVHENRWNRKVPRNSSARSPGRTKLSKRLSDAGTDGTTACSC